MKHFPLRFAVCAFVACIAVTQAAHADNKIHRSHRLAPSATPPAVPGAVVPPTAPVIMPTAAALPSTQAAVMPTAPALPPAGAVILPTQPVTPGILPQ
ncbi:MAG: hypothetical protein ACRESS_00375 [Stenotrophobium sp.]